MLPSFLIIGAQKCGTTLLHHILRQHSDIFLPEDKEPHFLAGENGHYDFAGRTSRSRVWQSRPRTLVEYEQFFNGASSKSMVGESSTNYLYVPRTITNIKRWIPQVKIIALVRNPVDRAFSNYRMMRNNTWGEGYETCPDFDTAIRHEEARKTAGWGLPFYYKEKGFYSKYLSRYYDNFDSTNIKVIIAEELWENPSVLTGQIFEFLGVKDQAIPGSFFAPRNVSPEYVPRSILLDQLCRLNTPVQRNSLISKFKYHALKNVQRVVRKVNRRKVRMDPKTIQQLKDVFFKDVCVLEKMIGKDLRTLWFGSKQDE